MTYEEAVSAMKDGKKVTRDGWNGRAIGNVMYTAAQFPDAGSMNTQPYFYMVIDFMKKDDGPTSGQTRRTPWFPSNYDMFSDDWSVVEA